MFFQSRGGSHFPISQIREISDLVSHDGNEIAHVRLADDAWVEVGPSAYRQLLKLPVACFQATPGTELLHTYDDEEGQRQIGRTSVCGWAVMADGDCLAITPSGINDGLEEDFDVLMPDGSVVALADRTFPTLGGYRQEKGVTDGVINLGSVPGYSEFILEAQSSD